MMISYQIPVLLILVVVVALPRVQAVDPRKLDDTTTNPVGSPNDEIKCGACPCGTTCYASPPPPIPSPPPPSPPPPPKKKTPSGPNCPPPPSGGGGGGQVPPNYIYIAGPPGDLYPVDQNVSAARRGFTAAPPVVVLLVSGLLMGMLAFW